MNFVSILSSFCKIKIESVKNMGLISGISAVSGVQKMKQGGTAKLSMAQITDMIINLPDATKNLSKEDFEKVYALYKEFKKCRTKMVLDMNAYLECATQIIKRFDRIAPYEKYSGGIELETQLMMEDIRAEDNTENKFDPEIAIQRTQEEIQKKKERSNQVWSYVKIAAAVLVVIFILRTVEKERSEKIEQDRLAAWEEGRQQGYDEGYDAGYDNGYFDGNFEGYQEGYLDGEAVESENSYNDGLKMGRIAGHDEGYIDGYEEGYDEGWNDGSWDAFQAGYEEGYVQALIDGYESWAEANGY